MQKEVSQSIQSYFQAFHYIRAHKLWKYLFISGLISFLVCLLVFGIAYLSSDSITNYLIGLYPFKWGREVIQTAGGWLVLLFLLISCLFLLKYLIIIALGPLLSLLSERIEAIEKPGSDSPGLNLKNFIKGFWRGIRINLRNLFMELWYTLLILLTGLIPVLNILSGPAIFAVQSFYAGFGNYDLFLERHLNYNECIKFMRMRRIGASINGLFFLVLLTIPVLGWVFAPFLSVVAASLTLSKDTDLYPVGLD